MARAAIKAKTTTSERARLTEKITSSDIVRARHLQGSSLHQLITAITLKMTQTPIPCVINNPLMRPSPNPNTSGMTNIATLPAASRANEIKMPNEDSVSTYRPESILVRLDDGSSVPALCFNLVELPSPDKHNLEYATKLREGAHRLELPADYVKGIQ